MTSAVEAADLLERPLPRAKRDPIGYAAARTLEALLESILALEFLERGFTRNAAGKAFQAWKALIGALLALEAERLAKLVHKESEKKWLLEKGVARVPTARLKPLSELLEELGYRHISLYTTVALALHSYQYHGPDPSAELTPYPARESAARDTRLLLSQLAELIESRVKEALVKQDAWKPEHQQALQELKQRLRAEYDGEAGATASRKTG